MNEGKTPSSLWICNSSGSSSTMATLRDATSVQDAGSLPQWCAPRTVDVLQVSFGRICTAFSTTKRCSRTECGTNATGRCCCYPALYLIYHLIQRQDQLRAD